MQKLFLALALGFLLVVLLVSCGGGGGGETPSGQSTIGPSGGTVTDRAGNQLQIPSGTFSSTVVTTLIPVTEQDMLAILERDVNQEQMTFLGGVSINCGGASFLKSPTLSFGNTSNVTSDATPILMRVLPNFNGSATLTLVAAAEVQGDRIVTSIAGGFPGIQTDGQYILLNPTQPLQFFSGTVIDQTGNPIDNAIVVPLQGAQFIAQTDPGAFIGAVPLPSPLTAQIPLTLITMFPPANPTQFGFSNMVIAPSPGNIVPIPSVNVPLGNATLAEIALLDFKNKCPYPDVFLEEQFNSLLTKYAKSLTSAAQGGTKIPTTPKSISLTPSKPTEELTIDFGAYYMGLVNKVSGGSIVDSLKLPPFGFNCQITMQAIGIGAAAAIVPAPVGGNPSIVVVSKPPILSNDGLTAKVTVSLPETGRRDGTTSVLGCVSRVYFNIANNYSLKCAVDPDPCTNGVGAPRGIDINPGAGTPICMEVPVDVTGTNNAYDGTYTGSWNVTCPTCDGSDNTASGTFTATVTGGAYLGNSTFSDGSSGRIPTSTGTVSSSGVITATPAVVSGCPGSVVTFTGQIIFTSSGGAEMTVTYSRSASGACSAESGTMTAARQ